MFETLVIIVFIVALKAFFPCHRHWHKGCFHHLNHRNLINTTIQECEISLKTAR